MEIALSPVRKKQEHKFRFLFLYMLFAYPVSSYITTFVGIESNIFSIIIRAGEVYLSINYLIFLIRYRLFHIVSGSFWLFLLFWAMYLVRIVYDTTLHGSMLGYPPSIYYLFGVLLSFVATIPLFAPISLNVEKFENACFKIVLILNLIGLYNTLHSEFLFTDRASGNDKLNPITTGFIASLLVVFSLRKIAFRKYANLLHFLSYVGFLCIGLAIMVITSTKSVFIFIALIILLFSIRLIKRLQFSSFFYIFLILFFLLAVVQVIGLSSYFELLFYRFQFTSSGNDRSSEERISLLSGAFDQIAESPVWGSFLEEKTLRQYPHNVLVESFMTVGFFGGIIYCILYLRYMYQTINLLFLTDFSFFFLISFGFFILSVFSGSLSFGPELWYFIAVTSVFAYLQNQKNAVLPPVQLTNKYAVSITPE